MKDGGDGGEGAGGTEMTSWWMWDWWSVEQAFFPNMHEKVQISGCGDDGASKHFDSSHVLELKAACLQKEHILN